MTHYNFYSDHIEVVLDGDVILDSRTSSMQRILDELYYDFTICDYHFPTPLSRACFDSLCSVVATLSNSSNYDDAEAACIISNLFILCRRRNFGHFRVNFITSK